MSRSHFLCPLCNQPLQKQLSQLLLRGPQVTLWCGNVSRCPSERAANDGGSGATEEAAYRALLLAVKHEEDNAEEPEQVLSAEELHERNEDWKADHANDIAKSGGV